MYRHQTNGIKKFSPYRTCSASTPLEEVAMGERMRQALHLRASEGA